VRRAERFPNNQAEVVFSDIFVEQLETLSEHDRLDVLGAVIALCENPAGKHPLRAPLAGWNTLAVLNSERCVVYKGSQIRGVGLVEVLCLGPRRNDEVYNMANALAITGRLTDEEVTQLWVALALLDVVVEQVGLDGWDYRPEPANTGLRRTAVRSGLLDADTAAVLSKDEVLAAMQHGWGAKGADPIKALRAALERARGSVDPAAVSRIIAGRQHERCGAAMPRAGVRCIRRKSHPGPHRARP
jgi:hypothetical protein